MNGNIKIELHPAEYDLIQQIRKIKYGKLLIIIQDGLPIQQVGGIKRRKFGEKFFDEIDENLYHFNP